VQFRTAHRAGLLQEINAFQAASTSTVAEYGLACTVHSLNTIPAMVGQMDAMQRQLNGLTANVQEVLTWLGQVLQWLARQENYPENPPPAPVLSNPAQMPGWVQREEAGEEEQEEEEEQD